jgi:hypothetical protein
MQIYVVVIRMMIIVDGFAGTQERQHRSAVLSACATGMDCDGWMDGELDGWMDAWARCIPTAATVNNYRAAPSNTTNGCLVDGIPLGANEGMWSQFAPMSNAVMDEWIEGQQLLHSIFNNVQRCGWDCDGWWMDGGMKGNENHKQQTCTNYVQLLWLHAWLCHCPTPTMSNFCGCTLGCATVQHQLCSTYVDARLIVPPSNSYSAHVQVSAVTSLSSDSTAFSTGDDDDAFICPTTDAY